MAIAEQEVAERFSIRLDREQREKLAQAAQATGQSLDEFAAAALLRAVEDALSPPADPLDKIIGIFKDEPLMDELMERIRRDRQAEIEAYAIEAQAEEQSRVLT